MEPCTWDSTTLQCSDFDVLIDGFMVDSELNAKARSGSCSTSSLVLDKERGELEEAATVRLERKRASAERSFAALRNHSEAERKRRARINAHLDTLRSLLPGTNKMDKASLLAEVLSHLKELKRKVAEASEGILMPSDVDEVRLEQQEDGLHGLIKASICCDCKPGILSDLKQALDALHLIIRRAEIATLEGRMKSAFVVTSCKQRHSGSGEVLAGSLRQAIRSVLNKSSASQEFSLKSNKRRRIAPFESSFSSSSGN